MNRRTGAQIEANKLDLEIFILANRMERFAAEWAHGERGVSIADHAHRLRRARTPVRGMMHDDDREATR